MPRFRRAAPGPRARLTAIVGMLAFLAIVPVDVIALGPTLCLFKRFFGVECFGCGMTRALAMLLHGDMAGALQHNRLVLVTAAFLLALAVRDLYMLTLPRFPGAARQTSW